MKGAAQAAMFEAAERKISAAVGAMAGDQAIAALLVAKQHEILAEQFDGLNQPRPLQFVDQRRRLPVHPHQFPARVLGPGAGDQVVLFLAHHGGGLRDNGIDREIEYSFEIKLLGSPPQASQILAHVASSRDGA